MKLLVLSSKRQRGHINDLIHRGFFDAFPGEVFWCGPGEKIHLLTSAHLSQVVASIQPDLILVNMKKRVDKWVNPADLAQIKSPKAIVEVDFCYERANRSWYEACGFNTCFFRHLIDFNTSGLANPHWLPFSIHPDWLDPPAFEREHQVGFCGTTLPANHYPVRNFAIANLKKAGLIYHPKEKFLGLSYMKFWREAKIGLTCGSAAQYDNAKHLIIPAAGALLFTDGPPGVSELLPKDSYVQYNSSDVVLLAQHYLQDDTLRMAMATRAYEHVALHHTHAVRWKELLDRLGICPEARSTT